MVCRHCGAANPDKSTYCSECGKRLGVSDVLAERTKNVLQDPRSLIILGMSAVIVILLLLLLLT